MNVAGFTHPPNGCKLAIFGSFIKGGPPREKCPECGGLGVDPVFEMSLKYKEEVSTMGSQPRRTTRRDAWKSVWWTHFGRPWSQFKIWKLERKKARLEQKLDQIDG